MQVLVTGVAGFIGYHVARALLRDDVEVVGIDSLSPYYDVNLKEARLDVLSRMQGFHFIQGDICERELFTAIRVHYPDVTHIVHLAAQAGVRASLTAPESYVATNIAGQLEVLEYARTIAGLQQLVYASSSSVYGEAAAMPFHEDAHVDAPLSLYGVTKRSGELMAQQYAQLYALPATGLRLFTAYGEWGRPDMAYYRFTQALYAGEEITLYDQGRMRRDFTYIDDIVAGILAALHNKPQVGHRIANLGHSQPHSVAEMLVELERITGKTARIRHEDRHAVEPQQTCADIARAGEWWGYAPKTRLKDGLAHFVAWFCEYHGVS